MHVLARLLNVVPEQCIRHAHMLWGYNDCKIATALRVRELNSTLRDALLLAPELRCENNSRHEQTPIQRSSSCIGQAQCWQQLRTESGGSSEPLCPKTTQLHRMNS